MREIRRNKILTPYYKYSDRPIMRVSAQHKIIVSHKIIEKLKLNPENEALMFKANKASKKIVVFKEEKAADNYNLRKENELSYKFNSKELHEFLSDMLGIDPTKPFFLEMNDDFELKKVIL